MSKTKQNDGIGVEMVTPENGNVTRIYQQHIDHFSRLGKEIKISPKSHVCVNRSGYRMEFFFETVSVIIGIGKDHSAELVMDKEAWEALKGGAKIDIETTEGFKKKYVYKVKNK